jgi:histidinol dehydrogenase
MMRKVELTSLSTADRAALLERSPVPIASVRSDAAQIVDAVRRGSDSALADAGTRHGGDRSGPRLVAPEELEAALTILPDAVIASLERAADNIRRFHETQLPSEATFETGPGVSIERTWTPLDRVGAYVPGGAAPYPSTVLMTVVPARVAGVKEVVVASPADHNGNLNAAFLGACAIAGPTEIQVMGGAQAIGALAYGTETIRRVDKIVGPGNAWVTAAKLAVFGDCDIDMPAGPSEVVVVADETANPRHVAADLLSQAEHGPDSPAVLATADAGLIAAVQEALADLLPNLARADTLRASLMNHGWLVLAPDHPAALEFADEYAPEHLTLLTADPETDAKLITRAGSVYLGSWAPEPVGDYASGANHVLPTGGTAASMSPLGVEDFGSWRQVQRLTPDGLKALRPTITTLATVEGLTAHRLAVEIRFEDERNGA